MIIIHPYDKTTEFLNSIYQDYNYNLLTEKNSNSEIKKSLINDDKIIMLGHGTPDGLLSRTKEYGDFDRYIINSKHVSFLREKECIGIWCNANLFAEKYNLKGLFSGMIISELEEAYILNVNTTEEEINLENINFAKNLKFCLDNFELKNVPLEMIKLNVNSTPLTNFNYSNLYYY